MRLPLIEVASQSDVSVGEGENGLGLRQGVEVESHLADAPLFDREGRMFDHRQAPSAVLSETTNVSGLTTDLDQAEAIEADEEKRRAIRQMTGTRCRHENSP